MTKKNGKQTVLFPFEVECETIDHPFKGSDLLFGLQCITLRVSEMLKNSLIKV